LTFAPAPNGAEANPVIVIAGVEVSIEALAALAFACTAAAQVGIINYQQRDRINAQINDLREQMSSGVDRMTDATKAALVQAYQAIVRELHGGPAVCPIPIPATQPIAEPLAAPEPYEMSRTDTDSKPTTRPTSIARTPEEACQSWFDRFSGGKFKNRFLRRGPWVKFFKRAGLKDLLCCLEWDSTHGAWEVFNQSGVHMGERSCEDLNDDPCEATPVGEGVHGGAEPGTHRPRQCMQLLRSGR
jgi:hypothetical protein